MTIKIEVSPSLSGYEALIRASTFEAMNKMKNFGVPLANRMHIGPLEGPAYMLSLVVDELLPENTLRVSIEVKELFYPRQTEILIKPL